MSRFHFATVDSSAYAECSLRLGQILFALIQPSSSMEGSKINYFPIKLSFLFSDNSYTRLQTTFKSNT